MKLLIFFMLSLLSLNPTDALCELQSGFQSSPILNEASQLRLCWKVADSVLQMVIESKNKPGWMGLGFAQGQGMFAEGGMIDVVYGQYIDGSSDPPIYDMVIENDCIGIDKCIESLSYGTDSYEGKLNAEKDKNQSLFDKTIIKIEQDNTANYHTQMKFSRTLNNQNDQQQDLKIIEITPLTILWTVTETKGIVMADKPDMPYDENNISGWYSILLKSDEELLSCNEYCRLSMMVCGSDMSTSSAQFSSLTQCQSQCAALHPNPSTGIWSSGSITDSTSNTLGCRVQHLGLLFTSNLPLATRGELCGASGVSGGGQCGTLCTNYCGISEATCDYFGHNATYSSCSQYCVSELGSDFSTYNCDSDEGLITLPPVPDVRYGVPNWPFYDTTTCHIALLMDTEKVKQSCQVYEKHTTDNLVPSQCSDAYEPTCTEFCDKFLERCSGQTSINSKLLCLDWCDNDRGTQKGSINDVNENTIGCFINAANSISESECSDLISRKYCSNGRDVIFVTDTYDVLKGLSGEEADTCFPGQAVPTTAPPVVVRTKTDDKGVIFVAGSGEDDDGEFNWFLDAPATSTAFNAVTLIAVLICVSVFNMTLFVF